jgi:hypothetical protein
VDSGLAPGTYYYRVAAEDPAGNLGSASGEASGTVPAAGDTTPPSVALTGPADGSTVSGTVSVTASASDGGGIAGVRFTLDGDDLGSEDTTSPYSVSWDTTGVSDGRHVLRAIARDSAGNTASSAEVAVTVSNGSPPPPSSSGPVAAYAFGEATGTTTADASGNGNVGTLVGASWTFGKYGVGLSFGGASSRVVVDDSPSLDLTSGMTLEAWVRPATLTSWRPVVLKERSGGLVYALYANSSSNLPTAQIDVGGGNVTGVAKLPANTWSHLAATWDGSFLRFYVNGQLVKSTAVSGTLAPSTDALRIGGSSARGEWFAGLIDEVRVYNRALTQVEIGADMNAPI